MKAHCNGNTETQKLLKSEIAILVVLNPSRNKHKFSVCEEIKDGDLIEVEFLVGKCVYGLNTGYFLCSC
jgi:hypothetical protein